VSDPAEAPPDSKPIRLHKYLPRCGLGGKRACEALIRSGRVTVHGLPATGFAQTVLPGRDRVEVDGTEVTPPDGRTYVLVHKPRGCVTAARDPEGRRTVFEVLPDRGLPRLFAVGRLDFTSEGLVLLTDDGSLARAVLHPDSHVPKTYHVKVRGHLADDHPGLARFRAGLCLHDGPTRPAPTRVVGSRTRATWVEVVLTEGRNRQIRRMCAAVGLQVVKLRRVAIGPVELDDLPCRAWRFASADEVLALVHAARGHGHPGGPRLAFHPGDEVGLSPRLFGLPGIPPPRRRDPEPATPDAQSV